MTGLASFVLIGWIPVTVGLFAYLPPRRAILISVIGGWLFLPWFGFVLPGIPDYGRYAAVSLAALVGSLLFDSRRWGSMRPRLWDVPMIVFCCCPMATEVLNGDGVMAGLSSIITNLFQWGIPYAIGRAYFNDLRGMRDLAIGVLVGAAIYMPLVWIEVRISPQLHRMLYGYHQHMFAHALRYGGFRPRVFMKTSIMLSTWIAAGTMCGAYLWMSKAMSRLWRVPMALLVPLLMITTILCKCGTGYMHMAVGIPVAIGTNWLRSRIFVLTIVIIPLIYITARVTGMWDGSEAIAMVGLVEGRTGESLAGRMRQEQGYVGQALKRPFLGSGDDRFMRDDEGERLYKGIEAFWVISLGLHGLVSVISIYLAFVIPALFVVIRTPRSAWVSSLMAPTVAVVVVTAHYAADCLFNGLLNPVYVMGLGGLTGLACPRMREADVSGASVRLLGLAGDSVNVG